MEYPTHDDNRTIGRVHNIIYKYIEYSDAKREQSLVRKIVEYVYYTYGVGDQMNHFNFPSQWSRVFGTVRVSEFGM